MSGGIQPGTQYSGIEMPGSKTAAALLGPSGVPGRAPGLGGGSLSRDGSLGPSAWALRWSTFGGGSPTLESVVRPFIWAEIRAKDVVKPRPLLPGEGSEAFIAWGKASPFTFTAPEDPVTDDDFTGGENVTTNPPQEEPPEDEQPEDDNQTKHTEVGRVVRKVKIVNPDDSQDYVWVERIEAIAFRNNRTGHINNFVFKNEGGDKIILGEGQSAS